MRHKRDREGVIPSEHFRDSVMAFSEAHHPSVTDTAAFTVAGLGLDPGQGGSLAVRGGTGCETRVRVDTLSALEEGAVVLSASGGLFFSETQSAQSATAKTVQTDSPPGALAYSRDFWLGATNVGMHALAYTLLETNGTPAVSTNITCEVVLAKLATNAFYAAYGSSGLLTVDIDPASYDPYGYTLYIDGEWAGCGWPQWLVDTSCLAAGVHTLTLQSETFPDLVDWAEINVIEVGITGFNPAYT